MNGPGRLKSKPSQTKGLHSLMISGIGLVWEASARCSSHILPETNLVSYEDAIDAIWSAMSRLDLIWSFQVSISLDQKL